MELDLDAFLQSHTTSSDDDENLHPVPRRTVDEIILNNSDSDSDSSVSSPSHSYPSHERRRISSSNQSLSSPKEQGSGDVSISSSPKETRISSNSYSSVSNFGPISRLKSRDSSVDLSLLVPNVSTPLPPLFGAVRSSAKPGDALAAAAAASRSFPTPHAAAIKSRRASSRNREDIGSKDGACDSEVVSESGGADLEGFRVSNDVHNRISSETSQSNEKLVGDYLASSDDLRCTNPQGEVSTGEEIQGESLSEVKPLKAALTGVVHEIQVDQSNDYSLQDVALSYRNIYPNSGDENNLVEKHTLSNSSHGSYKHSVPFAEDDKNDVNYAVFAAIEDEENNINYAGVTAAEDEKSNVNSAVATAAKLTQKDSPSPPFLSDHRNTEENLIDVVKEIQDQGDSFPGLKDGELSNFDNDSSLDFKEDDGVPLESRTENKLHCSFKPLDLAEELEKKHAFTGLHLEEGAAAQPMRLEGVTKGSTVLGYFDVDANNIITRTISSQAFRRDHGYPQVVAVHLNFIAVGMSRGLILVVPCKYYPYRPDNMDAKFMMLGLQGDRSHAPVTSMCFSPQGDLLFSGYGDGHITVWDVLKASIVKVINEHRAPVVHLLYLGQDSQVTRQFDILSGDSKGVVKSLRFSVLPWINMISFSKSTPLLDGQTTSTVICAAVLLSDEYYGGPLMSSRGSSTVSSSGLGSMMGGVVGGDAGRKLFEGSSLAEEGVVIFVTHQSALVAKVIVPDVKVYAQLPKPEGVQDGSMPYAAWKCMAPLQGNPHLEASERVSLLGIAWDRTVQVAKLVKSELKVCWKWTLESSAVGISWLNDQMLVILTTNGQICLFERDGTAIHQTSFSVDGPQGDELVAYHTHFSSNFGNTEKAYHDSLAARGASIYILGPMRLVVSRLLPWKERIEVLRKAGDWMGALNMATTLFDGQAHGVIDLPGTLEDVQKAVMPYLVELLLSYVDEVFSYISVAFGTQIEKLEPMDDSESSISVHSEIKEQFTRVGGVAVEFCVHIKRTDILFDEILSRFISVKQKESFLELLEPYILKDMLGSLPPEIMQALVEHYSSKGWLQRVEQCVLHMDISSLDFNQVVRLCREHRLYGALIYLFNKGLDDFRTPLEELLLVLRSSPRESATSLGYRMLVYLKYCFRGLAFPPGHGTLPPTRLTSLRKELVEFLMENSGSSNSVVDTSLPTTTMYPNLYHLLEFDTQAALDVLGCAFVEDETSTSDYSLHGSSISNAEITGINDMVLESQNLVQDIVHVLSRILDMGHLQVDMSTSRIDSRATDIWPSNADLCYVFEFISHYVACGRAYVSREILSQILEYLTSETNFISSSLLQNFSTFKIREKQVLALLEVVPEKDWDAFSLLHMCEKAQFHLVCGFVHAIRHQYVAALDNYMKDMDEPIHAFFFIDQMLAKLSGNELDDFQSAVISRIPSLIKLSRAGAFFLLSDRFDSNTQEIFSQLHSSPESHFLYLKTVFEVHSTGAFDVSCLRKVNIVDFPSGRSASDQSDRFRAYLDRIYNFPKFLRNNPIHLTDETIELYLELLCRYERKSVLKFLETFESYRVEQCLGLCQDYGIVDATAFLLERVGDAGSALSLTLSDLDDKFVMLDASVRNVIADVGGAYLDAVLRMEEVIEIFNIVHSCIGLCQRNSPRLDPDESESLWFQLLDSFCDPLMDSCNGTTVSEGEKRMESVSESFGKQEDEEECKIKWKVSKSHEGAHILRKLFPVFIKEIVEGMIGYVRLPTIMSKLLSDNGSQEFGDFKLTILGMLGTYDFEKRILDAAKSLIEDNTFYTMSLLKRGASHGYAPRGHLCCVCCCPLTKDSSNSSIRIFSCGHATHPQCELQDNGLSPNNSLAGCPICIPKNIQRTKSKSGLVNRSSLGLQQSLDSIATHPHEIDAFDNSYGLPSISRFELLTNLQKDQRSIHIESIPQLRLAPPAVYHEKVKKGNDLLIGESSSSVPKVEKTSKSKRLRDIKVKGSSIRFPLKSNIFGKEKTVKQ